jgi:hypothetical protein
MGGRCSSAAIAAITAGSTGAGMTHRACGRARATGAVTIESYERVGPPTSIIRLRRGALRSLRTPPPLRRT